MNRRKVIAKGIISLVVGALGLPVWSQSPKELPGGRLEKRGKDYILHLKPDTSISDIVRLDVMEGYRPSIHVEFQEMVTSTRPSQYVKDGNYHHYIECMGNSGRMQFHTSLGDDGISVWFEYLPTSLAVDAFLNKDIALRLDMTRPEFTVYIPLEPGHDLMTVTIKDRKVDRIVWL